ncbi:MAG: SDR family NAD(P)-dependent oxidoreductase [Gammaproteobacteria bacterium]|nr:SDR family NAD(P)-dependent oxidoreductase [Gammaproteobacteria bacterium]MBP6050511.1 SDR family NAD(P)-dependent oxidoreductase [Pseudomonadales bacterium]MBK6583570.1 SDR family NAD(P)-dependent oxidoreductase [Gammaproteobacteria bacterium]MBK7169924.1 SDR family NAD(P)-dependent oxidoreductase [Gammaproteobacteria bacterium]MBK7521908.1 SDR family NAD(P)-dependent oxidoreductase [Gammaproteobacteria bacterium]
MGLMQLRQKTALVLGATSNLAKAISRELAVRGYALILVARDRERVQLFADEIVRGGGVVLQWHQLDFLDEPAMNRVFADICARAPVDVALVAQGLMASDQACRDEPGKFNLMVQTNLTSAALCAERCIPLFDSRRGGDLVLISSISGDRVRARNYFYGATKAGLDAFVQGLRLADSGSAVNILNLKPGPLEIMMGGGIRKGLLQSSPDEVARLACDALGKGRHVLYAPRYWRWLMWVLRRMPERLLSWSGI